MKVYNLTNGHVDYRGKTMPAYGSSDHPDLVHVPARDLLLAEEGILAFGSLPKGWSKPEPVPEPTPDELKQAEEAKKVSDVKQATEVVKLEETVKVEVKVPPEAKLPEVKDESKKSKQK